jgi:hypothetical protein
MKLILFACLTTCWACTDKQDLGEPFEGPPPQSWALAVGGSGDTLGVSVAIDSRSDVILAGSTSLGPIDLGNGPVGTATAFAFITKRAAADGTDRWSVELVGEVAGASGYAAALAVDGDDAVIVAGQYVGVVDFGGQTMGMMDFNGGCFVAKYASDGGLQWVRDVPDCSHATTIGIDSAGNVFTGGNTQSSATGFLAAYDGSGTQRWRAQFQGTSTVLHLTVASNGDVVVAGELGGLTSFGGPVLDPGPHRRTFVVRYDGDGTYLNSQVIGPPLGLAFAGRIAAEPSGLVVYEDVEWASGEQDTNDLTIVHAFDPGGAEVWSAVVPGEDSNGPNGRPLATTSTDLAVSCVWFEQPDSLHPGLTGIGLNTTTIDAMGNVATSTLGQRLITGPLMTAALASAVGASGKLAITGGFGGEVDFGTGPISSGSDPANEALFLIVTDTPPGPGEPTPR